MIQADSYTRCYFGTLKEQTNMNPSSSLVLIVQHTSHVPVLGKNLFSSHSHRIFSFEQIPLSALIIFYYHVREITLLLRVNEKWSHMFETEWTTICLSKKMAEVSFVKQYEEVDDCILSYSFFTFLLTLRSNSGNNMATSTSMWKRVKIIVL